MALRMLSSRLRRWSSAAPERCPRRSAMVILYLPALWIPPLVYPHAPAQYLTDTQRWPDAEKCAPAHCGTNFALTNAKTMSVIYVIHCRRDAENDVYGYEPGHATVSASRTVATTGRRELCAGALVRRASVVHLSGDERESG